VLIYRYISFKFHVSSFKLFHKVAQSTLKVHKEKIKIKSKKLTIKLKLKTNSKYNLEVLNLNLLLLYVAKILDFAIERENKLLKNLFEI